MITSNENLNAQHLVSQADQLALIAEELSQHLAEVRELCLQASASAGSTSAATRKNVAAAVRCPEEVCAERQHLIAAWTALEAEQRKQAISRQSAATQSSTSVRRDVDDTTPEPSGTQEPAALDFAQQFRFLQRECDRHRNS